MASAHVGRLVIVPEKNAWLSSLGRHRSDLSTLRHQKPARLPKPGNADPVARAVELIATTADATKVAKLIDLEP
jgi:hypothetical protein